MKRAPQELSNAQLVAALIGVDEVTGASICKEGLRGLPDLKPQKNVGPASVWKILAAMELGVRVAQEGRMPLPVLRTPADVARYLMPRCSPKVVEEFGVLCLDVRNRVKRDWTVSSGCLTSSLVHPREVYKAAVDARAAAIILYHNHPSGDPEPSAEDVSLTRRLASAGTLMGIEVVDHMILGAGRYVSFKERGLL